MRIKINTGKRTPQMRILSAFMAFLIFSLTCPELFEGLGVGLIVHATTYNAIHTGDKNGCMSGTSGSDSNYTYSGKIKTGDVTVFDYLTDREIEGASINLGPWGSGGYLDPYGSFNGTISGNLASPAYQNITIIIEDHYNNTHNVKMYAEDANGNHGVGWSGVSMTYIGGSKSAWKYVISTTNSSYLGFTPTKIKFSNNGNNPIMPGNGTGDYYTCTYKAGHTYYINGNSPSHSTLGDGVYETDGSENIYTDSSTCAYTNPLYLGMFYITNNASSYTPAAISSTYTIQNYNNFHWLTNMGLKNTDDSLGDSPAADNPDGYVYRGSAAVQGLVKNILTKDGESDATPKGKLRQPDNTELPYFSTDWADAHSALMKYYDHDGDNNIAFPFYEVTTPLYSEGAVTANTNVQLKDSINEPAQLGDYAKYYQFSSKDSNLYFTGDSANNSGYFAETNTKIWSSAPTSTVGFFPFDADNHNDDHTKNNLGFGMKWEMPFTLQPDGCVGVVDSNGEDRDSNEYPARVHTTFEFKGDDDLWVFIDGNLILDMGGDHFEAYGKIDFATGIASVDKAVQYTADNQNNLALPLTAGTNVPTLSDNFKTQIAGYNSTTGTYDNRPHVITIFYMERGMADSNLLIRYNYSTLNNFSKMKIQEITNFDNVNTGLLDATMKAAENDVFKYTAYNTGTSSGDVKTQSKVYPDNALCTRTNQGINTVLTTAGTGNPTGAPYNYSPPSSSSTEGVVKNTSYIWVDDFASMNHATQGTGKTTNSASGDEGGSFFLMYGTKASAVGTTAKESSAEFGKQFSRYSLMRVKQIENNDYLYRPDRGNGTSAATFTQSTRKISDYYTSRVPYIFSNLDTSAENELSGNNAQFAFRNNIYANRTLGSSTPDDNEVVAVQMTEVFENTVNTRNLNIKKTVSGNTNTTQFTFKVTFEDVFGVESVDLAANGYGSIEISGSGNASNKLNADGTFTLQAGKTATISGIPYGTKYTVTETGDRAPTVRGEVTTPTALTSADRTVTVEVTNEYPTKVTVKKITTNEGDPSGAELDLYYKEKTIPPAYIFNDPFVTPTKQITVTIPTKPTAPAVQPVEVTNTTKKKTYSYKYETENTPSVTPTSWILPRSDNDYIYFRDYNSGSPADHDAQSFTGGQDTTGSQNAKRSWLYTDFSTNVETQNHELNYTHNYWFEAQFSGPGKADVKYSIWERFVDRYNSNGKEQDTVVWKIQPPDGYNEVRFCMYDGGHCIRTTEKIKFRLGEIYEKTDWGGIYKNEGVDCYFNVPLNDEQHNNWATHRTTGAGDPDKRMTNFDSTNGASTMQQAERYVPTEQKVIFHCNSNQVWHNIHIEFFKNTGTDQNPNYVSVGQQFPGYMMEPYAYAGDNYRIGNYLTYELTIPDGATHFRVNNGVALNGTSPYRYSSDYTKLYDATDKNGKKNYANYFKIQGAAGTTAGVNVTSGTAVTLDDWTDYPSADERNKNYNANEVESDYDYVYFEAPNSWGSHIYAYFYGGGDLRGDNWQRAVYSIWPGITPVGTEFTAGTNSGSSGHSDIYDYPLSGSIANPDNTFADKNNSTTVYKFKIPLGERKNYSKVIFNNGLKSQIGSNTLEETGVIDYNRGYLYKANGSSYQHYENKPTNQFEQRGDKLYIRTTDHATGTNGKTWDDLHVKFYNKSGTQILQGGQGYVMQYAGVKDGHTYYAIPIPQDAAKFSLNNGKSSYSSNTGTKNDLSTGMYDIPSYNPSLDTNNVTTADVTKGNVVYTLTNTSLEQTSPKITMKETVDTTVTTGTFTPENPSPRGDHLYIRDAGNILNDTPTITFYEFEDSSTDISTTLAAVKLEDSPEGTDWYSIGIPVNASYFTMTYNSTTTAKTQIYAKSSGANQLNATPGDMYYDTTTTNGLEITWPTFTSDADDLTDEHYTATSPSYGQRGDNLYVVSGSALSDPKVIFYNSIGVPIVNAAGNSEISLKSLGQITAPASGAAPIDGKTSNDTNAQGCWYRAAIPAGAATFAVKYGSTTTEQEKIYEKSSKIKRYSNDYTLDGMQYRINGTSATLLYPVFEEDPNYTLDAGGGQVINSNGSTVRVDTTKVSDYANYGAATAEKMNGNITPALYQTTTNDVTYQWGSSGDGMLRFDNSELGWSAVYVEFFNSSGTSLGSPSAMSADTSTTKKITVPENATKVKFSKAGIYTVDGEHTGSTPIDMSSQNNGRNKMYKPVIKTVAVPNNNLYSYITFGPLGTHFTASNDKIRVQYFSTANSSQPLVDTKNIVKIDGWSYGSYNNSNVYRPDSTVPSDAYFMVIGLQHTYDGCTESNHPASGDEWVWTSRIRIKDDENNTATVDYVNQLAVTSSLTKRTDWYEVNITAADISSAHAQSTDVIKINANVAGSWTTTVVGNPNTASYQPEDRFGMISTDNSSSTPVTLGTNDGDNYIKIVTNMSDPYIRFYSNTSGTNAIGTYAPNTANAIPLKYTAVMNGSTAAANSAQPGNGSAANPYLIRLPKTAKSFTLADGATGIPGNLILLEEDITVKSIDGSLYTVPNANAEPYVTLTNYRHGGTTFIIDGSGAVTSKVLRTGYTYPKSDITDPLNPRSDIDYVYFTDTDGSWGNTVYAYFYGGEDGEYTAWPGVRASTSDKAPLVYTNSGDKKVFMFQLPKVSDGKYPYVIFNNGSGNGRKETQAIRIMDNDETAYTAGGVNYSLDASNTQQYGTSDSTNVLAYATTGTTKTSDATVNYSSSKYIYIINNGTKELDSSVNRDTLDDLHIVFYDSNNNVVGTSGGYKPDKLVKDGSVVSYNETGNNAGSGNVYRIAVPANAAKFQITNGNSDHQIVRQSEIKPIAANGLYRFVPTASNSTDYIEESSVPADINNAHFLLDIVNKIENDDEDTPEIQTYDVKLATVVTGADGSVETIKWLKDSTTSIDHEYLANENANGKVVKVKKQGDYYWKESKAPAGYQLNPNPVRFTIDGSETDTVSSTVSDDPLPTGSLTVKKKVAGENIPTADQNKEYTFTVNLTLQSGVKWSSYSSGVSTSVSPTPTGGDTVPSITSNVDTPLVYTIKLKHNQTATISGLPQGTTYQVTETSTLGAGWTTTYKINSAEDATTGTSTPATGCTITGSGAVVEFTNTYEQQIETGVILTKTAKEKVGTTDIGDTLAGAKFKLVNADDTATEIKLKKTATDPDGAVAGRKTHEYVVDNGGTYNIGTSYPETGEDGRLHIKGLPVGSYYLEEQEAPDGYSHIDSNTGTNRKVYFSVGDNTVEKEISCTDEMDAAYIRLFEHISEKKAAWGDPTFIFKITNTDTGKTNLVSLTVNDDGTIADTTNHKVLKWMDGSTEQPFTADPINNTLYGNWLVEATSETEYKGMYHIDSQGRIRVEPGNYEISRMPVSRYKFVTSGHIVYDTNTTTDPYLGSFTTDATQKVTINDLEAGKTADVHYYDEVDYYDKFSHVDEQINKFYKLENGANKTIKGIRIADYHTGASGTLNLTGSNLTVYAIYADGTESQITDAAELGKITFSYTAAEGDTSTFNYTRTNENKTLNVNDVVDYKNKVYTITATYDSKFTTTFDLVFARS